VVLITTNCIESESVSTTKPRDVMKPKFWLLPATIVGLLLVAIPRAPADEFYEGKTITFVVGFAAGGGFDTYTRLIARHIGKHIPGNPTVVVENRTGAGSLIAANYIYNQAPRDGTVIGSWIGPLVLQQVLGNKAAKFDGRKFGWLGAPTPDTGVCALTEASGIKTMDDWFKSKRPIKIGSTAPGSTTSDVPRLVEAALGLPIKLVEGYKGTAKIRLAAESGEIDGGCWAWESIKPTWAKALQSGEVHIVLQTLEKSHPDLKNVPLAIQYAKSDEARALLDVANGPYAQGARPYSVPPDVPQDRLQLLQKAFMETLRDPDLLKEAKKSKLDIDPVDGPAMAKLMTGLYELNPALKAKLTELLIPGGNKKM
jgi:tripartite-type tricarboxylate transporter receptor subunit TctC